ncbi:hypothetical protein [Pseudalkalibacillus caeni]|uniref:Uncharacterized protein n=1 Tax=Exobacillus caeni TaxID=2574798 RepID=A0A5R9F5T7_9BACL|nr:hypothetical protein [Pseudalkalibacillus caeni]TLS37770.1 hypothetical protein FCL54_08080 [Pseudalkalibacillus caeni]
MSNVIKSSGKINENNLRKQWFITNIKAKLLSIQMIVQDGSASGEEIIENLSDVIEYLDDEIQVEEGYENRYTYPQIKLD